MVHAEIEAFFIQNESSDPTFRKQYARLYFKQLYFLLYFDIVLTIQTIVWLVVSQTVIFSAP